MLALTNLKRLESLCLMEAVSLRWCPLVVFTLTFFVLVVLSLIHATDVLCGLYGRHARSLPEPSEPSVRTGRDAAHVTTTTAASNSFPHNLNPHSCNIAIFFSCSCFRHYLHFTIVQFISKSFLLHCNTILNSSLVFRRHLKFIETANWNTGNWWSGRFLLRKRCENK